MSGYAARVDHVAKTVSPALARGDWVVSDRFAASTVAYQGHGHEAGRYKHTPVIAEFFAEHLRP